VSEADGTSEIRIIKRSVLVAGHATSVSIEEPFWEGLKEMAAARGISINALIAVLDGARRTANLSSAIRLAVLDHYRGKAQGESG
jgi:predicted DNA-binding ribbon-helix-helix protein